jgi:hypothetical protein
MDRAPETTFGQQESLQTITAVTAKVVVDAKRSFGTVAEESFIERCAQDAVEEIWRESVKVTSFVPVLAMRRIREEIDAISLTVEAGSGR